MKNPTAHFDAHTGERWEWCSINYVYERKYHPFSLSVEENGRAIQCGSLPIDG